MLQYLRIFNFRICAYGFMALSSGYGIAGIVSMLASCKPFAYMFHKWQAEYSGVCIGASQVIYAGAVINIILDVAITLLPTTQM